MSSSSSTNLRGRRTIRDADKSNQTDPSITQNGSKFSNQNGIDHQTTSNSYPRSSHAHLHLDEKQKEDIQSLVLWRRPLKTIYHASHNMIGLLNNWYNLIIHHIGLCLSMTIFVLIFFLLLQLDGGHRPYIQLLYKRFVWCLYWCGLGILSSVGFGTGLHTFILYLGPHIAKVTLAAYECNSLDFPEPPYPDEIICPNGGPNSGSSINVWSIMSKVRLEAFMWGAGTALGELPPYFISRAHRLAMIQGGGSEQDDILEELEEIEELVPIDDDQQQQQEAGDDHHQQQQRPLAASRAANPERRNSSIGQTLKTKMILLMKRMGFFGILACASIPNPLFDLAGIICGYSLISFWTFFGATLLGKAIIKMHIQKLVVIIVFNETYVQSVLAFCQNIPYIGHYIHNPLRDYLQQQKNSLHRGSNPMLDGKGQSWIAFLFEKFVIVMVSYFMVSIINSMAQSDLKQYYQNEMKKNLLKDVPQKPPQSSSSSRIGLVTANINESIKTSPKKLDKNE